MEIDLPTNLKIWRHIWMLPNAKTLCIFFSIFYHTKLLTRYAIYSYIDFSISVHKIINSSFHIDRHLHWFVDLRIHWTHCCRHTIVPVPIAGRAIASKKRPKTICCKRKKNHVETSMKTKKGTVATDESLCDKNGGGGHGSR